MPWRDHLKRLKGELNHLISEPHSQSTSPTYPPPASSYGPPPQSPMTNPPGYIYWQPQFRPDVSVGLEWDPKLGNGPDGWGNQELEFYTDDHQNAFQ